MPPRPPFQQNPSDLVTRTLAQAMDHHRAGRLADAERLYRAVLELAPRHGAVLRSLGSIYAQTGKLEQALPLLQAALQVQPNDLESLNNLGLVFLDSGHHAEAVTQFRRALRLNPSSAGVLTNLGIALYEQCDAEGAIDCYEKALKQKPDHISALNNTGTALLLLGRVGAALEYYERALALTPGLPEALWAKSLALLATGNYREGWKLYETGLGHLKWRGPDPFAPVKPWDGKPAPDKHLLIWSEQGLGDSLQFIRYAELCKQRVGKVSVLCPKPLVRLFKALPFIDDAFEAPREGSHFDAHVPMMSLPHLFETVLESVPAAVPYLRVDPEVEAKWAGKFLGITGVKIGLVWAGSSHLGNSAGVLDQRRSIGLDRMSSWLDLEGAQFYNLQMGAPASQIATLGLADRLTDFMGEVTDMADTAAIVQNLDLVITVDTSVAHLAGGLGKPVWILSRYDADWRWLQNRPTNPWYPTARIFGQPTLGDWDSVMAEVGRELANEIAKKSAMTTSFVLSPFRTH